MAFFFILNRLIFNLCTYKLRRLASLRSTWNNIRIILNSFLFSFPFWKQRYNLYTVKFLILFFFFLMLARTQLWNPLILIFFKSYIYQLLNFRYVHLYIKNFSSDSFDNLCFIRISSYISVSIMLLQSYM